ncbi:hypothetical protein CMUS01_13104 [Colletotrichum musicola]|uniref:Uncharacterized protein n=1 Tax=Colletotrichum musicola TaxID=2175873 RepID=A0A8H6MX23_9PEZI|nr:hypothetical protein CMUS01_13104 [Colletotrichum musicola]
MPPNQPCSSPGWSSGWASVPRRAPEAVLQFSRSIVAEFAVWALLLQASAALLTLFLFVPLDLVHLAIWGEYGGGKSLGPSLFGPVRLPLGLRRTPVSSPRRLDRPEAPPGVHATRGDVPPIRWFFEIFCSLANHHHLFVPDAELYLRKGLRQLGICRTAVPTLLGTVSAEEHLEIWIYALKYIIAQERLTRRPQKAWKRRDTPIAGVKSGDFMRALCATEVLCRVDASTRLLLHRQALKSLSAPIDGFESWEVGHVEQYMPPPDTFGSPERVGGVVLGWLFVLVLYWPYRAMGERHAGAMGDDGIWKGSAASVEDWFNKYVATCDG